MKEMAGKLSEAEKEEKEEREARMAKLEQGSEKHALELVKKEEEQKVCYSSFRCFALDC